MSTLVTRCGITHKKQTDCAQIADDLDYGKEEENRKPIVITISGREYYNASDLQKYVPVFFYGCSKAIRKIVEIKEIPGDQCLYVTHNVKTGWNVSKDQKNPPSKANLLLTKDWVHINVPNMQDAVTVEKRSKSKKDIKDGDNVKAPKRLFLEDHEKFRDDDGNILEIETCGERTFDGIYFLLSDVASGFKMEALASTVIREHTNFELHEHYEYFVRYPQENVRYSQDNVRKMPVKKQLYLTYTGILKILFSGRSGIAKKFIKWATETLFTVQMGTTEQKDKLASDITGIPVEDITKFLYCSATPVSCVYRFTLGKVKDLREAMNILNDVPDEHIVVKYGYTDNLRRRAMEHRNNYEKIEGCKIKLLGYAHIDSKFLSEAETSIKFQFKANAKQLLYEKNEELFTYDPLYEKDIDKFFAETATRYSGCLKDINEQLVNLKHKVALQEAVHKNEIYELERELMVLKYEHESKERQRKQRMIDIDNVKAIKLGRFSSQ
ncbi:hypothetical protein YASMINEVIRUS_4 [Yasminevirus sp. GU-2018]|uniref:Bro-N domain-containing protein n=1 Tax=Yasminevirus sp. GU-2018 TaxID=2420051 RepID=A0A5K0U844_9VIRU|nr:hypothetical protein YASMINEVIRUS_4 [Yasminevirus sp. GU-2018]